MAIPLPLSAGQVAVYGLGIKTSASGVEITEENNPLRFGSIYGIWDGGEGLIVATGDNVMFNENQISGRLTYQNVPYTIVPARVITKDEPLP